VPQGGGLRPLLANIFLHRLDEFVEQLIKDVTKGSTKKRQLNPQYHRLKNNAAYAKSVGNLSRFKALRREMRGLSSLDPIDTKFRRMRYVRYADDFLIGVIGPFSLAKEVLSRVTVFLRDSLKLNVNWGKTRVISAKRGVRFLGALLKVRRVPEKKVVVTIKGNRRRVTPRIQFHADIKGLLMKLSDKGYFKFNGNLHRIVPTGKRRLVNLDHADIIKYYNRVSRGLLGAHGWADTRKSLGRLVHGLKMSCALTLALKFRLRTAHKVFRKFGSNLKCPSTGATFFIPDTFARHATGKKKWGAGSFNYNLEAVLRQVWPNKFTHSSIGRACLFCGSKRHVHIHHIRKVKDLRDKSKTD
jgi:hypothetical protein